MADVHQKTSAELPGGFRLSRKPPSGEPPATVEKEHPCETEKPPAATVLFRKVMDTIPDRVMEYPIPFPSLHAILERHPKILRFVTR